MPMSPGGTKTGMTGTTRKAVAKKVKIGQSTRSMVKAVKHAGFSGTGYKTGKNSNREVTTMPMSPGGTKTSWSKRNYEESHC
ncbi:hypothetical protein [Desulfurobacterium sp.]